MDLSNLFGRMAMLFIYIIVGFIAARVKVIDEDVVKKINRVLMNICLPAMIISSVLNTELKMSIGDVALFFGFSVLMQIILLLIGYILSPVYVKKKADRGLYVFMTAFGNTGFMGIPVITALFGNDAVFLVSIAMIPFFLFVYSIGIILLRGETKGEKSGFGFLLNPALVSTFIAVLLFFIKLDLPKPVLDAADGLSGALVPLSMVVIGANIGMSRFSDLYADWRMYVLSFIKLILSPVLMFLICRNFVQDEMFLGVLVVSSAMPVAALASMLSIEYNGNTAAASRGVFITTLLSLASIPFVLKLLFRV